MTLDGLICTYARTTTSVQVYLRWPPGRSVRSRAASTRCRRPLRHENDCWLRLLAHVWMGFASFFVSALTRSWATGLKFYGLQRYSLKISFGQRGGRSPVSPPKRSASALRPPRAPGSSALPCAPGGAAVCGCASTPAAATESADPPPPWIARPVPCCKAANTATPAAAADPADRAAGPAEGDGPGRSHASFPPRPPHSLQDVVVLV